MSRPLKFCMISIFYPPYGFGGDAVYLHRLCEELVQQGHQVDVVHCADSYHTFVRTVDPNAFPASEGVTVHTLESGVGMLSPLLSHQTGAPLLKSKKIKRILNTKKFDVIHYHNISLFGPGVLKLQPRYPAVKVYSAHEHWLVCPVNVLWQNNRRACQEPTCFSCMLRSKRPPQLWRYTGQLRDAAREVDVFLAPSRFSRNEHRRRGFREEMKLLPYFAAPPNENARDAQDSPHPRPYFLFVGRLEKIKGVQEILPHFQGEGDYDLLVVGAGSYQRELRKQAENLPRVRFAGWVNQNQLGPYYRNALAVVVPSITYETFGLVVIEAFAHRKPVIVHDIGAPPELVEESGGGFVYRNHAQFREKLELLAADPELRRRLGLSGYSALQRKWSPEPHLEKYYQYINEAALQKFSTVPWESAEALSRATKAEKDTHRVAHARVK